MALVIAINGSVTLDESAGLQNTGTSVPGFEDNNDDDVDPTLLPPGLFSEPGAQAGDVIGAAASASDFITVTSDGAISSLGFVKADGSALPVYGVDLVGVSTGLSALDGGAISLFSDGARNVLGVDAAGDIVFALYMDASTDLTSAKIWMAQFEPLSHPVPTNPDDAISLLNLGVAAGSSLNFNFSSLPSGQSLFGTVGSTAAGLVVIGKTPVLNADGTFTNASNTINTSQGGGPTTIGVNNQMFDPGEGAYFTFVNNPVESFLAGGVNGLDQNEADDADNIQYTGGTLEVDNGHVIVSQIQGNSLATMKITAYDTSVDNRQGQDFATHLGAAGGTAVGITAVRVYNAAGTLIEDTAAGGVNSPTVAVSGLGGAVTVSGLGAGYKVEWDTAAVHDQVLIEGVVGKFDIGGFGTNQATPTPDQILLFEATVVDGDGDSSTDAFAVGIDGTGPNDDGVVAGVDAVQVVTLVGVV